MIKDAFLSHLLPSDMFREGFHPVEPYEYRGLLNDMVKKIDGFDPSLHIRQSFSLDGKKKFGRLLGATIITPDEKSEIHLELFQPWPLKTIIDDRERIKPYNSSDLVETFIPTGRMTVFPFMEDTVHLAARTLLKGSSIHRPKIEREFWNIWQIFDRDGKPRHEIRGSEAIVPADYPTGIAMPRNRLNLLRDAMIRGGGFVVMGNDNQIVADYLKDTARHFFSDGQKYPIGI